MGSENQAKTPAITTKSDRVTTKTRCIREKRIMADSMLFTQSHQDPLRCADRGYQGIFSI